MGSLPLPDLHQSQSAEVTVEETEELPSHVLVADDYFVVHRNRKRVFVTGQGPAGLKGKRGIQARAWKRHQNLMARETAWERAERYRRLMAEGGHQSVRALAQAIGEDFSKIARFLKLLDLPSTVLEALRRHAAIPVVRVHFTAKRLRQMAMGCTETQILAELSQISAGAQPSSK